MISPQIPIQSINLIFERIKGYDTLYLVVYVLTKRFNLTLIAPLIFISQHHRCYKQVFPTI